MLHMAAEHPTDRAEQHRRIAERYAAGDAIADIAASEDVDRRTVRNVARRANLPLRLPRRTERNNRILRRYADGEPVVRIATDEGVQSQYVSTLAKKAGLPTRRDWQRKYPIKHDAFDQPNSVGWWLIGLLAADGCVHAKGNYISLSQREEDTDVLRAFLEYVGADTRPLAETTPKKKGSGWHRSGCRYYEARIFSRQICESLARHGVRPQKTRTLVFGEEAAAQPAVWLGLFDGDGSAGVKLSHGIPRIDFFGTRAVMEQCATFWGSRLTLGTGQPPSIIKHAGGLSKVAIYGSNAALAARIMLDASPVSMQRKRRVLQAISSYVATPSRFGEREKYNAKGA